MPIELILILLVISLVIMLGACYFKFRRKHLPLDPIISFDKKEQWK